MTVNPFASFRDPELARSIARRIGERRLAAPVNIMEFCGGHTVAIFRSGIRSILPEQVRMLSGPGCPVCVTSNADLDKAMALARLPNVILATYGDMMKVPGSSESLFQVKAAGCRVEVVYSPLDALSLAMKNPDCEVVFFGIGFETTAPATAAVIVQARERRARNFSVCSVMKLTIPGAMALLSLGEVSIDGIVGPGHVSTVIGSDAWRFLPERHGIPVAISGFEPVDILSSIDEVLRMIETGEPRVVNAYTRSVKAEGNRKARALVDEVFETAPAAWRGFGVIPESGLAVRDAFGEFDAERRFTLEIDAAEEHPACRCGDVLRGAIEPVSCSVFATACTPDNPLGPCMVSSEGTCAAYYHFQAGRA
jgi:hydrogenase expression/formation protein HypD